MPRIAPVSGSVTLRAIWSIHVSSGRVVIPAIVTMRSARLITKSRYWVTSPLTVHTSTVKKSLAAKTFQFARKNVDQVVCLLRSGAGAMPLRFSTLDIVPRATLWLRFANAP